MSADRRAGKIDAGDESLFNGDVLTGHMAAQRGLIDGIGEVRAVMRARYGENVRLRAIATERRRPLWGRLPFIAREPADIDRRSHRMARGASAVEPVRAVTRPNEISIGSTYPALSRRCADAAVRRRGGIS